MKKFKGWYLYNSMHFLLQNNVSQVTYAFEPIPADQFNHWESDVKFRVIDLGSVFISPRILEEEKHSFPHEQCCIASQCSISSNGRQISSVKSSIFDLTPETVKLAKHKSANFGIWEDVSSIVILEGSEVKHFELIDKCSSLKVRKLAGITPRSGFPISSKYYLGR